MSATAPQDTKAQQPVRSSLTLDSLVPFASPKRLRDGAAKETIRRMSRRDGGSNGEESDGALPDRI